MKKLLVGLTPVLLLAGMALVFIALHRSVEASACIGALITYIVMDKR